MPAPEESGRTVDAVLWTAGAPDRYGQPTVNDPIDICVRWNTKRRQAYDANGNLIALDATVVVDIQIPIGSLMWKGCLDDWMTPGTGTSAEEVMEVVTYGETDDIRGRESRRTVGLRKYRGSIPS